MTALFCFGLGYSAKVIAHRLAADGWTIAGTSTTRAGAETLAASGVQAFVCDGTAFDPSIADEVKQSTHLLVSAPPGPDGDPILQQYADAIVQAPAVRWIGYLSTIGVYGDRRGAWVDEDTPAEPSSERSKRRLSAENAWLALAAKAGKKVQIFRLAGIYGPGRSAIDSLRNGAARRIVKPGQVFNRIHVDDIAIVVIAAMRGHGQYAIYNVTDDEPAPPQDVVAFGAEVLGIVPPAEVAIENAGLSPMGRSFYAENKRVRNQRIKDDLGIVLHYPTYREGLAAIASASH